MTGRHDPSVKVILFSRTRGTVRHKMYNRAIVYGLSEAKCTIAPYFLATLFQNKHLFAETAVWKDLEKNNYIMKLRDACSNRQQIHSK